MDYCPEFWHFLLEERKLQSWRTDTPARTLVRLAFKAYQMNLPFSWSGLSLLQGDLFLSHQKKISEMEENWSEYPFSDYKLQPRTKKSFQFAKQIAV